MAIDMSLATAPPRRTPRASTSRQTSSATRSVSLPVKTKKAEREEAVEGIFQLVQFACVVRGNHSDAGAIGLHGKPIAHETAELADKDERVAKSIDYLLNLGPYAGLIAAVTPLLIQVMANHNRIKTDGLAHMGIMSPKTLEAQSRAAFAKQALEAVKIQKEAEAELQKLQDEMAMSPNGLGTANPRSDL
jgi:hypothetical protein